MNLWKNVTKILLYGQQREVDSPVDIRAAAGWFTAGTENGGGPVKIEVDSDVVPTQSKIISVTRLMTLRSFPNRCTSAKKDAIPVFSLLIIHTHFVLLSPLFKHVHRTVQENLAITQVLLLQVLHLLMSGLQLSSQQEKRLVLKPEDLNNGCIYMYILKYEDEQNGGLIAGGPPRKPVPPDQN